MIRSRSVAAVICVIATISCTDPMGVAEADGVRVEMRSGGLVVQNRTNADVYYHAIDRSAAADTEWIGCGAVPVQNPASDCEFRVPRGDVETVASSEVTSWGASQTVNFYWWQMVPASGGGWQQGSVHLLVVSR